MSQTLPDFDQITDTLRALGAESEAAENHGLLCAMLCTMEGVTADAWLDIALSGTGRDALAPEPPEALVTLFDETRRQFDSDEFDFHLLLPHDEAILAVRIEALGHWCQGFLAGLAVGGIQQPESLPGELPEIIQDMLEIARAEGYELEDDGEDEAAYAELVEYLRMGVLLFREEFRRQYAKAGEGSIH
ncbi:UPF0149 family protein [Thiohalophilus sp.]|uniref:UPF0149 family protein n=1 Tax=Thiohalophilus sp. TaxID=3028392 RepID=UPI002ACDFD3C|nr:UPF0149 family protein [Thiohalophilus sp.]MDZ7661981.1 UPF0149 family protein [Thiohalophilus sp.]